MPRKIRNERNKESLKWWKAMIDEEMEEEGD